MNSNNNNLIDDILKAIDIMATKKIASTGYDRTIQATIISCQDQTIGKYKVKYQDGYWYAYSTSGDISYSNGTSVYILIPCGDMRKEKTILGAVQKLGTNYLNILEQEQKYNFIGDNIIINSDSIFGLSSYKEDGDTIVLYNKNNSPSENLIQINQQQMLQYLKQSPSFIIGADIQTQLNIEQQYQGNYGILVGLDFLDNATKSEITRYYVVDVDMMTGNPYKFINGTHQSGIFEIDNPNFLRVNLISLFTKDFPNQDNSKPNDIFISNLEIKGAVKLSQTELDTYALLLSTPKGYIFNDQSLDTDTRRIEAEVRIKGKTVNLKTQSLPFYWFVQNNTITARSKKYNRYGGQGWECLNQYNVLNDETFQYVPMSNILEVKKEDILIERVKYKCVTIYDNTILSKEITIINKDAEYRIFVESDQGTLFKYDVGSPTLTCHCQQKNSQNEFEDVDIDNYKFVWSCINNVGNFESLADSTAYTINENQIINLNIKSITRFATYKCAVFTKQGNNFLGTASITLNNLLQSEGFYTLVINNGSQVFKYNTYGVSPTSKQNAIPLEIPVLNFTLFDDIGNPIDEDIIKYSDITWTVPIKNTLLEIDDSYQGSVDSTLSKKSYKNLMSLSYGIAELYDPNKIDNTIQLKVNYNGMTLVANTNLTFTKEGNSGTNGTDFVCKIVPNVTQGGSIPVCPTLQFTDNAHFELNWITDLQNNHWFKAELWHNGNEPIFSGYQEALSTEGKNVIIIGWEVLRNKYKYEKYDDTNIIIQDALTGRFSFNAGTRWSGAWDQTAYVTNWVPANIIKVTLQYDGLTYYATLPLIIVKKFDSNYRLNLKPNTGFRQVVYTSAGIQPSYNNRIPFELIFQHKINSYWEDITDNSQISYKWYYFGSIKERGSIASEPAIIQQELTNEDGSSTNFWLMLDKRLEELKPYQKGIKPADQYDGECKNIGLGCRVYNGSTTLAWIHIPIHMLRNRFENSALNGWDGNSVDLGDNNGGTILAPQIGAGYKDENNRFTGIVMGRSKDPKAIDSNDSQGVIEDKTGKKFVSEKEDVGLFGFHEGSRSIFLDARTGKAVFGEKGKAQIVLDPSQTKNGKPVAQIKSGDYNYNPGVTIGAEAGAGMMIDLSTPQIKYGTGNFEVNNRGHLIVKGGGSIANWEIGNYKLSSNNEITGTSTGMSSQSDPNGEGAVTVSLSTPFDVSIPTITIKDKWKRGGVFSYQDLGGGYQIDMEQTWTEMPNRMDEEWLSNEHYVTRPDSTVKILAIGDHNDGNADYMKNYATSHPNYACVHINTSLKNNYSGVIVDLLNSISTQNYKIQLVILAYKFITSSSTECLLYFSSPVSNFSQSGVLIEIPGSVLQQSGTGNKFSYLIQLIKKDGTSINLSDSTVQNIINNIAIRASTSPAPSSQSSQTSSKIKAKAFWTKNPNAGTESYITHDGFLVSNTVILGRGNNKIYIGKTENTNESALFSFQKYGKNINTSGFYLGTDGLAIGKTYTDDEGNNISNFQVDIDGSFYAREGYIGNKSKGWTVTATKMYNGAENFGDPGFYLAPQGGISIVSGNTSDIDQDNKRILFSVNNRGVMTSRKAYIANWQMTDNMLLTPQRNSDGTDSTSYPTRGNGSYSSSNASITISTSNFTSPNNIAITRTGIRVGNSFLVTVGEGSETGRMYCTNAYLSGTIYGTAGKIGDWTIDNGKISSSKIELDANNNTIKVGSNSISLNGSDGSITLGGFAGNARCSISSAGTARFKNVTTEKLTVCSDTGYTKVIASYDSLQLWNIEKRQFDRQGLLAFDSDGATICWVPGGSSDISARKYKIIKRQLSPAQYKKFYNLRVYQGKFKDEIFKNDEKNFLKGVYHPMFIAEQVAELDKYAATYNWEREIQNWNYRVIIPIQHLLIRDLNDRVSTLEKQIKELKQLINK